MGRQGWIGLAQDRDTWWALVNAVMYLPVPYNAGDFLTSLESVTFSLRTLLQGDSQLDSSGLQKKMSDQ